MAARKRAARKQASQTLLTNGAELATWAEHEGWLDDSVLVSVKVDASGRAHIRMGLRLHDTSRRKRAGFNRDAERFFEFSLIAEDARLPKAELAGAFEVTTLAEAAHRFGLELDLGGRSATILAKRFRVVEHGEVERVVALRFGPELTFRGPGPVTIAGVRRAVGDAGVVVDCFRNWVGSGQSMGSAFVTARIPKPIAKGAFEDAIRVVPEGVTAKDGRGLWLTGQSFSSDAYVNVEASRETHHDLLAAVVRGLGSMKGLAWASSGNMRLETPDDRERWLREFAVREGCRCAVQHSSPRGKPRTKPRTQ